MSNIPFATPTLLRLIADSIPHDQALNNPQDAIAIFMHACMLSVGFRLVGLAEDDRLGTRPPPVAFGVS